MGKVFTLPKEFHPDFAVPNRKPVGPVEVDWSNPITRGLQLCVFDGTARNLVNNAVGEIISGTQEIKEGNKVISSAGSAYIKFTDAATVASLTNTPATVLLFGNFVKNSGNSTRIFHIGDWSSWAGILCEHYVYTGTVLCITHSGLESYNSTLTSVNGAKFLGYKWQSPGGGFKSFSVYQDANKQTYSTSTLAASWTGVDAVTVLSGMFNSAPTGNSGSGTYLNIAYAWDRELSDAEIAYVRANKNSLLKPRNPITYFIPSAGGGAQEAAFLSALSQSAVFAAVSIKGAGITQAVNLNTQFAGDAASNAAVSAGLQAGYSAGSEISVEADLSFALQSAMSITADAAASSAILAAVQSGILFAAIAQTEATITTGSNVDVVMIAQTSAGGVVEAGVGVDVIAGAQLSADAQTNSDLIATNNVSAGMVSQGLIESNVTGGISVDSQVSAEVSQEVSVSFSLQLDATKTAEAIANASITMNTSLATTILAQAAAEAGISVGQIINVVFTATSINGDVITPEGRTYRVSAESRIFVVPFEDRNFTIH